MKSTEKEKYKLEEGCICLLKNYSHVESHSGIPFFKMNSNSYVRKSAVKNCNNIAFLPEEIENLKSSIDLQRFLDVDVVNEPDINQNGDVLSFAEFCASKRGYIRPDQYVEVNIIIFCFIDEYFL